MELCAAKRWVELISTYISFPWNAENTENSLRLDLFLIPQSGPRLEPPIACNEPHDTLIIRLITTKKWYNGKTSKWNRNAKANLTNQRSQGRQLHENKIVTHMSLSLQLACHSEWFSAVRLWHTEKKCQLQGAGNEIYFTNRFQQTFPIMTWGSTGFKLTDWFSSGYAHASESLCFDRPAFALSDFFSSTKWDRRWWFRVPCTIFYQGTRRDSRLIPKTISCVRNPKLKIGSASPDSQRHFPSLVATDITASLATNSILSLTKPCTAPHRFVISRGLHIFPAVLPSRTFWSILPKRIFFSLSHSARIMFYSRSKTDIYINPDERFRGIGWVGCSNISGDSKNKVLQKQILDTNIYPKSLFAFRAFVSYFLRNSDFRFTEELPGSGERVHSGVRRARFAAGSRKFGNSFADSRLHPFRMQIIGRIELWDEKEAKWVWGHAESGFLWNRWNIPPRIDFSGSLSLLKVWQVYGLSSAVLD